MRKRNFKGRCEKRKLPKFKEVCKTYDRIQTELALLLSEKEEYEEIYCNVGLEGVLDDEYMSDFVCVRHDGSKVVYECSYKKHLVKPMTSKLLDASRNYWLGHGVAPSDWVIVVERGCANEKDIDE